MLNEVEDILRFQKKRHTDQIPFLVELSRPKNAFLPKFLYNLQRLLWCIDDTVDNSLKGEMIYKNEVAKFILFIEIFKLLAEYQMKNAKVFDMIFGKPPVVKRVLSSVEKNIETIVRIPEVEREMMRRIEEASKEEEIFAAAMQCLICRASVIDLYNGVIEAVEGIRLPIEHLRLLRAVQLLREDFEDAKEDVQNGSINVVVALSKRGVLEKTVIRILQIAEEKLRNTDNRIKKRFEQEMYRLREILEAKNL